MPSQPTHRQIIEEMIDESTPLAIGMSPEFNALLGSSVGPKYNMIGGWDDYKEGVNYHDKGAGLVGIRIYSGVDFDYLMPEQVSEENLLTFIELLNRCYNDLGDKFSERVFDIHQVHQLVQWFNSRRLESWLEEFKIHILYLSDERKESLITEIKETICADSSLDPVAILYPFEDPDLSGGCLMGILIGKSFFMLYNRWHEVNG